MKTRLLRHIYCKKNNNTDTDGNADAYNIIASSQEGSKGLQRPLESNIGEGRMRKMANIKPVPNKANQDIRQTAIDKG